VAAHAQPAASIGIRAQGMGGAFTAIADDSTATWWNPAGLAGGAFANAIIEAGSDSQLGVSAAFPALGVSYYRLRAFAPALSTSIGSTGGAPASRQDTGAADVRALDLSQFGATVGQSLGQSVVVASTIKLLRGGGDTRGGLDAGVTAHVGPAQMGLTIRNLTAPTFGEGVTAVTLQRQVRAGLALSSMGNSSVGGAAAIDVDADLTTVRTASGDERRIAAGLEWLVGNRRLAARAGISASTVGGSRTAYSAGLSWAVQQRLYVDGRVTAGSDDMTRGWGLAARVTF